MLTDLVIANMSDAEAIAADGPHTGNWPRLEFKNLDNKAVADLLSALSAEEDAAALRGEGCLVYQQSGEGPWVFQLPTSLAVLLAKTTDEQTRSISDRWASGEAVAFLGARGADLEPVVRQLCNFSRQAVAANKPLLLWMSL